MSRPLVWMGIRLHPQALAILEEVANVFVSRVGELNDWYAEAATADAIIVAGATPVTGEVMDCLGPQLRVVARTGIGVDRIDLDAATSRGILVVNTPDGPTESTAEHAIALMLDLCKQVSFSDRILRSGSGFPQRTTLPIGLETSGAVLGLVGLGRIGSRVAAIAQALGMKVLAFDPFITPERASSLGVELLPSLEELLPCVQVLSIHCPSIPETRHIINARTLSLLPGGSYFINVSRGALVDEAALVEALRSGHLAGAGLDVFDPEPAAANNALFSLPNTICTPHIGSYTAAGQQRIQVMACQQVISALRGERPSNLANAQVWGHQRT